MAQLPMPRVPSLSLALTDKATLSGLSPTLVTDPDSFVGVHVWLCYAAPSVLCPMDARALNSEALCLSLLHQSLAQSLHCQEL